MILRGTIAFASRTANAAKRTGRDLIPFQRVLTNDNALRVALRV
jgi:hypothetical protein